jgi:hypothetical protein
MSTRDVTGKCAVKNCAEAFTEWNYNTMGSDKYVKCLLAIELWFHSVNASAQFFTAYFPVTYLGLIPPLT